jgi:hypothetical protein
MSSIHFYSIFDWTVHLSLPNIRAYRDTRGRVVMGEGDEPLIELRSIFVANTKRFGYHVGGCQHEPIQAPPKEHRDNLTAETRSLDF